jgi:hypothetical protein
MDTALVHQQAAGLDMEGCGMKYIVDFFALVGLVSTVIGVGLYMGYTQHKPECSMWVAALTKECK